MFSNVITGAGLVRAGPGTDVTTGLQALKSYWLNPMASVFNVNFYRFWSRNLDIYAWSLGGIEL